MDQNEMFGLISFQLISCFYWFDNELNYSMIDFLTTCSYHKISLVWITLFMPWYSMSVRIKNLFFKKIVGRCYSDSYMDSSVNPE